MRGRWHVCYGSRLSIIIIITISLCRLQLRLPSGGKSILQIKTDDSLGSLRERIAKVGILYSMYCMYILVCVL